MFNVDNNSNSNSNNNNNNDNNNNSNSNSNNNNNNNNNNYVEQVITKGKIKKSLGLFHTWFYLRNKRKTRLGEVPS